MPAHNSPTLNDVAKLAKVSNATVSRVMNNSGIVSENVRTRVLQAAEQLHYSSQRPRRKNAQAPWLAILTDTLQDPFFIQVIAGIQAQAEDQKLIPYIVQMSKNKEWQRDIINQIKYHPLVGIISAGFITLPGEWIAIYDQLKVPIVVVNTLVNHPKITSIRVNFEQSTYRATQHLLDMGHTRIAYIGVFDYDEYSCEELQGVKRAIEGRNLQFPEEYQIAVPLTLEGASQGVNRLMTLPPERRPTAIYAFDDQMAIYVMDAIRYYKLRIPEDISIIGFDDIPMARHTNPPLTTIDIPKHRLGRLSVLLLKQLLDNELDHIGFTFIDGSVIVRESTGPAPTP